MPKASFPEVPGFTLAGEIGRGAHSVVYRGVLAGVPCAVKLPRVKARWTPQIYREAVSLARVKHPCLPAVLDVGEVEGLPYLAMELVDGPTLADRIVDGPLDEEAVLTIAIQLAGALAAVHAAGLVHRDVKPRNIVFDSQTSQTALKLVDFGFATPMERVGAVDPAGTAAYAAPEQLVPPGRVDGRADLYALGRLLFECLCGRLPAGEGKDSTEGLSSRAELVARGVSPELADILAALLKGDPNERYPSAQALLQDLQSFGRGLPVRGPRAYERAHAAPPLIGRDAELAELVASSRDVKARGGAVVLLRGTRGAGKSRLLDAARPLLAEEAPLVVSVRCEREAAPLSTLHQVLAACCAFAEGNAGARDALVTAIGNLAAVARVLAPREMAALLPANDLPELTVAAESLAEGAAEIVIRVAGVFGPVVLVVDDAQWMDPPSVDALARVAHRVAEAPIALILGSRLEAAGRVASRFDPTRVRRVREIVLHPLEESAVRGIVASYLSDSSVDPAALARIQAMADGTPLGVLEVLRSFLDAGALRPRGGGWVFDQGCLERAKLPTGAIAFLGRRIAELPAATRRVLEMAAVLGSAVQDEVLASALELSLEDLGFALALARRASILELEGDGGHRFVHDSIRETLLEDMSAAERRQCHDRIADVLEALPSPTFGELCATATHFHEGDPERDPARAVRLARAAATAALARYDNETALHFLGRAERAAGKAGLQLGAAFHAELGEAHLRLAAFDPSLEAFEVALRLAPDVRERARILERISWVYQVRAEPERAHATLARAFEAVGQRLPAEDPRAGAVTASHLVRLRLGRVLGLPTRRRQEDVDLLCSLHYQNARLSLEQGRPASFIQSSLEALELSERGGSEVARARARAFYGLVLTALGAAEAGAREVGRAKDVARRTADPATIAFTIQIDATSAAFTGDTERTLRLTRELVDVYGPWLEVNEFTYDVVNADILEVLRGRSSSGWSWMERALDRLRRTGGRPSALAINRARASFAAVGGDAKGDPWFEAQLGALPVTNPGAGFHRVASWGPRARYYLESGRLDDEFEALVTAFEREGHNPKRVQPIVCEYYVAVAHARVHQCLRDPGRPQVRREALRKAAADLNLAARVPILKAHAKVVDAFVAFFEGNAKRSSKLTGEADAMGNQQSAPWILYSVARLRAHALKDAGKIEAARDQARVAELYAHDHGAVTRTRWIREEFGLVAEEPRVEERSSVKRSSSRTTHQLATLLNVANAPRRELKADQQGATILDELIASLGAERAAIWFKPESNVTGIAISRHRSSQASVSIAPDSARGALLSAVHASDEAWPSATKKNDEHAFDVSRTIAMPLHLYDKAVGALMVERAPEDPVFVEPDRHLLELLSHQVPLALELARLLAEREQLHSSLGHAKKMEAMGALAGGLAHDFNNMLAAMRVALTAAQERAALDSELTVELDIIAQATTRAGQLTSQLLSFSRHQPVPVAVHDINQLVSAIEPMLRRVVGQRVSIKTTLSTAVDAVEIDQNSFDQAIVNLVINARDAMPGGGTITLATRNVSLGDVDGQKLNLPAGEYVELEIADTGQGMSSETMTRIFEPFFTTKPVGSGTGLGLSMVYAFARNCGGSVDVSSEVGEGTKFRIYFRRASVKRASANRISSIKVPTKVPTKAPLTTGPTGRPVAAPVRADGPDTILVVDDDDLVRRSIAKILERNGYRVVAASGSAEAISVAREQGQRIALIILDVLMPGVTGPELGRRLDALNLGAKLLFVSGFSPESIPIEEAQVAAEMLLQKPFTQTTLLERVRQLMQ